jgi:hypothetical protein
MTIRSKLSALSNNAFFAQIVGGLIVVVVITMYGDRRWKTATIALPDFVTVDELANALAQARTRVQAVGYVVTGISPDYMSRKFKLYPKFEATMIMTDPFADAICRREYDEDNQARNYQGIIMKLREFRQKTKPFIGERFRVGVSNVYPTMTVIIIDDDLYTYFYPFRGIGIESPVLKFANFNSDERAKFFQKHLDNVIKEAKVLSTDQEFKPYETAKLEDPCFK